MQQELSESNKRVWNYRAYEFWQNRHGTPQEFAATICANPCHAVRRHIEYLGDIKGRRIINILGSNGRKAVPLAILGADVTVIFIHYLPPCPGCSPEFDVIRRSVHAALLPKNHDIFG